MFPSVVVSLLITAAAGSPDDFSTVALPDPSPPSAIDVEQRGVVNRRLISKTGNIGNLLGNGEPWFEGAQKDPRCRSAYNYLILKKDSEQEPDAALTSAMASKPDIAALINAVGQKFIVAGANNWKDVVHSQIDLEEAQVVMNINPADGTFDRSDLAKTAFGRFVMFEFAAMETEEDATKTTVFATFHELQTAANKVTNEFKALWNDGITWRKADGSQGGAVGDYGTFEVDHNSIQASIGSANGSPLIAPHNLLSDWELKDGLYFILHAQGQTDLDGNYGTQKVKWETYEKFVNSVDTKVNKHGIVTNGGLGVFDIDSSVIKDF